MRKWDEVSFTIQAQGRNAPLHPQAPLMIFVSLDERRFDTQHLDLYRRLSVRECARIQTFPDSFHFLYSNVLDGYKMVGNAVPPRLAKQLAESLKGQLTKVSKPKNDTCSILVGYYRNDEQLRLTKENKLYYVRTGFRPGAIQIPPGQDSPDCLLLHRGKNLELFRLKKSKPILLDCNELKMMGFAPHGDFYFGFQIDKTIDINCLSLSDEIKQSIICSTKPFLLNYNITNKNFKG